MFSVETIQYTLRMADITSLQRAVRYHGVGSMARCSKAFAHSPG